MLSLAPITGPADQLRRLSSFDPAQATWVVSDLKTKLDLSRKLLSGAPFIPGDGVLRASELWRIFLKRLRPDLQSVSREFAVTLIAERLEADTAREWARGPGAAQVAYDYLTQLMPIVAHPNGREMMAEWFAENEASQVRWGRWYELTEELWRGFLEEGLIAPPWVSGVLVNEPGLHEVWNRPLVIDLGAELTQVEADLLVNLAAYIDIEVLVPEPSWRGDYAKTLVAYEIIEKKLKVKRLAAPGSLGANVETGGGAGAGARDQAKAKATYRKFTTMIAEVKDATAQVRAWLEGHAVGDGAPASQGEGTSATSGDDVSASNGGVLIAPSDIAPSDIAIVAPDIESYWPSLSSYLDHEGVPCQKNRVRRLHSYPDIARWFANLRLRSGAASEADVELSLFDVNGRSPRMITYERFKTLYTTIYGREDLERSEEVARRFAVEIPASVSLGREDFVAWSLKHLPGDAEFQRVELLYRKLFAECPQSTSFSLRRWLAYFEQLASKTECSVQLGEPDGISCINLSSAENSPCSHMIILGLTEGALRRGGGTAILYGDIASLAARFGFHLASEDQSKLEFEARWVTESADRALVLSVPETDFAGSVQAASWLWVRGAREQGAHQTLSLPRETRWDLIQRAGLEASSRERGWRPSHIEYLDRGLQADLGFSEPESFAMGLLRSLSPSKVETYLECPFVFAAKYLFGLSDVADLDLEVDPSRRGSLMHKLFEILTREPFKRAHASDELDAILEQAKTESGLEFGDVRLWPPLKARYKDLALRFLSFEAEYRAKFPALKTAEREFDIAGYLRPSTGELVREAESGALRFSGRIDRVDEDRQGNLAIIDYKSSKNGLYQFGSWLKNNKIQLLLYAMAVEKGLTAKDPRPVLAALYYSARPLHRETGFKVEGVEQGLYETSGRAQNKITPEEKEALFKETEELIKNAVAKMMEGQFKPGPRDERDCATCQWSGICRAPHLNT